MLTQQDYRAALLGYYRVYRLLCGDASTVAYARAKASTKPLPEDRATQRVRTAALHAQERAKLYDAPMQVTFHTVYGNLRQDNY
jgi:hypothetical protein